MSIWGVKLSTWIDKTDPNCNYKSFVKAMQKFSCSNPKCNHKCGYGMWDLHSAPFGNMDGPFCSKRCMHSGNERSRSGKMSKKKIHFARLALVSRLLDSTILDEDRKKEMPFRYGVTLEQVMEFKAKRSLNKKGHERANKRFNINLLKEYWK